MSPILRKAPCHVNLSKACAGTVCLISETHHGSSPATTQVYQDFPHAVVGGQTKFKLSSKNAKIDRQVRHFRLVKRKTRSSANYIGPSSTHELPTCLQEWPGASTMSKLAQALPSSETKHNVSLLTRVLSSGADHVFSPYSGRRTLKDCQVITECTNHSS